MQKIDVSCLCRFFSVNAEGKTSLVTLNDPSKLTYEVCVATSTDNGYHVPIDWVIEQKQLGYTVMAEPDIYYEDFYDIDYAAYASISREELLVHIKEYVEATYVKPYELHIPKRKWGDTP
jgi:hypothetical protein